jgi:hypothetical protein
MAMICLVAPMASRAQGTAGNPVSAKLRQILDDYSKFLVSAAEEMPAEKYSYHPMPEQMTFGKSIDHVAEVNNFACSKISGVAAPEGAKLNDTDKDKLVEELKASMDICKQAFSKLTDAKLGEMVPWFGRSQATRVSAALEVTNDLIDHYAALAVYLRLNSLLPPTAQRK